MKDRLLELKIEIEQLEQQNKTEWLELKLQTLETFSNSWLSKLFSKNTSTINLAETPLKFVLKEAAECLLDQTPLAKSKSKWASLVHYSIEMLLPEIIDAFIPNKKKRND
jgi:hypothetical protein